MTTNQDAARLARHREQNERIAKRALDSLRGTIHRAETGQLTGRNRGSTEAAVAANITRALTAIIALEDAHGIGAAGNLGDRLTALRWRATDARLISTSEYLTIEREVCAA